MIETIKQSTDSPINKQREITLSLDDLSLSPMSPHIPIDFKLKDIKVIANSILNLVDGKEVNEKINLLILDFFNKSKQFVKGNYCNVRNSITYFEKLKNKKKSFVPVIFTDNQLLDNIFTMSPFVISDFLNLFDCMDQLLQNKEHLSRRINEMIKNKEPINNVLKYLNFFFTLFQDDPQLSVFKNEIKIEELLLVYFTYENYVNYLCQVKEILLLYPARTVDIMTKFFLEKKEIRTISNLIIKFNLFQYLTQKTYDQLMLESKKGSFNFFYMKWKKKEMRLIAIYDLFFQSDYYITKLGNRVKEFSEKLSNLILTRQFEEKDELELYGENDEEYLQLPKGIVTKFISIEDRTSIDFLDNFINIDVLGIDSEWKPGLSMFERKKHSSDIIQIASKDYVAVLDTKSFVEDKTLKDKFISVFKSKTFVGFSFKFDLLEMDPFFKEFFTSSALSNVIELTEMYSSIHQQKCPDLSTTCKQYFGKHLNKMDRISNWEVRPLKQRQMEYCCLDAFILLELYHKLIDVQKEVTYNN